MEFNEAATPGRYRILSLPLGTGEHRLKRLIVTADDFGRSTAVNEAVEQAFSEGILTSASLIVSANQSGDAVGRAIRCRGLGVGLHLVVVNGKSILSPSEIPDLVDQSGEFDTNLVRAGFRYFFLRKVRQQLNREIRAQFEAFRSTGLELDHVNAHNHMHLHPTILSLILKVGPEFGLCAVRVPYEPIWIRDANWPTPVGWIGRIFLIFWLSLMRFRLRRVGLKINDRVYGIRDSGAMVRDRMMTLLKNLPNGVTEIYSHPARGAWDGIESAVAHYRFEDEYQALVDPEVRSAAVASGAILISFKDI